MALISIDEKEGAVVTECLATFHLPVRESSFSCALLFSPRSFWQRLWAHVAEYVWFIVVPGVGCLVEESVWKTMWVATRIVWYWYRRTVPSFILSRYSICACVNMEVLEANDNYLERLPHNLGDMKRLKSIRFGVLSKDGFDVWIAVYRRISYSTQGIRRLSIKKKKRRKMRQWIFWTVT